MSEKFILSMDVIAQTCLKLGISLSVHF